MRVDINHNNLTEAGELKIKYKSLDQLDFLITKLEKQS